MFNFLKNLLAGWPNDIPRLYPQCNTAQLEGFLTVEQFHRIKKFRKIYILPFCSEASGFELTSFGLALSHLMQRNLMLLKNLSIHSHEDTPDCTCEYAAGEIVPNNPDADYVLGNVHRSEEGFALDVKYYEDTKLKGQATVNESDFHTFLRQCTETIVKLVGGEPGEFFQQGQQVGQPLNYASLIEYGKATLQHDDQGTTDNPAATALLTKDPDFILPAWHLADPKNRPTLLAAYQRDPFNASLCFNIFCRIWNSQKNQPHVLQYARRAIELSPGMGKAHMCLPHAAKHPAQMLRHSCLGYILLPGNSFAISNYLAYLLDYAQSPLDQELLAALAYEGICCDPQDPGVYRQMIQVFLKQNNIAQALQIAQELQIILDRMSQRTYYCLCQNPQIEKMIKSGQYHPAAENRKAIAKLKKMLPRS